jgi:hypothetical protein
MSEQVGFSDKQCDETWWDIQITQHSWLL